MQNTLLTIAGIIVIAVVIYFLYKKSLEDKVVTDATVNAANAVQEAANRQNQQTTTTIPVVYTYPNYYRGWNWRRPHIM